jgi:hypothetical protein
MYKSGEKQNTPPSIGYVVVTPNETIVASFTSSNNARLKSKYHLQLSHFSQSLLGGPFLLIAITLSIVIHFTVY